MSCETVPRLIFLLNRIPKHVPVRSQAASFRLRVLIPLCADPHLHWRQQPQVARVPVQSQRAHSRRALLVLPDPRAGLHVTQSCLVAAERVVPMDRNLIYTADKLYFAGEMARGKRSNVLRGHRSQPDLRSRSFCARALRTNGTPSATSGAVRGASRFPCEVLSVLGPVLVQLCCCVEPADTLVPDRKRANRCGQAVLVPFPAARSSFFSAELWWWIAPSRMRPAAPLARSFRTPSCCVGWRWPFRTWKCTTFAAGR